MITVRLSGGMGNQMFQYALGRALSLKNKVPLALDVTFLNHRIKMANFLRPNFAFRNFDLDVFNIEAKIAEPAEISFWNKPFFGGQLMLIIDAVLRKLAFLPGWEKSFNFDSKILSLGPDTYLQGFWQSEKYFSEFQEQIRKDFTLKVNLPENSQKLMEEIKSTESLCMHVRRSDKVGLSFYKVCDGDYYNRGIEYVAKNKSIGKIYVFSDDVEWCEKNIKFSYPVIFVGQEYAGIKGEGHMALMSACKNFIIANSTFSWWAAWLADYKDKIVIAPQKWFSDATISMDDLIPKGWVKL